MTGLSLTADWPSSPNAAVVERVKAAARNPRIAWITPFTRSGRERFPLACRRWETLGFSNLEYCDIDEEPDPNQLSTLERYDVVYLSGGDPVAFRARLLGSQLGENLRRYLEAGGAVVCASGGSMQFTPNVSLYRLKTVDWEAVVADRDMYDGLGIVDYELLPHMNRFDTKLLDKVRRYSERVPHPIIALADGAALIQDTAGFRCAGQAVRYQNGVVSPMGDVVSGASRTGHRVEA